MLRYQRNQLILAAVVFVVVVVVFLMLTCVLPGFKQCKKETKIAPITLEFWNVFEERNVYQPLIQEFKKQYPHITVDYAKKEFDPYRDNLAGSFTQGEGPDIFAIHNTWLPIQKRRISPVPPSLLPFNQFRDMFPDVVRFDFTEEVAGIPQIYALPLFVDTLGLFYNRAYFNNENILDPPATWEDFVRYVKTITQYNDIGEVDLAGAAIGTALNINRSTDILSLLMMQSGTRMTNESRTRAAFHEPVFFNGTRFDPGVQSLEFYTSFADPANEAYTWQGGMSYSIDAFVQGDAAMMFNYSYMVPIVERKNRYLDFSVAEVPHPKDQREKIALANYWGLTVSKDSENSQAAWLFILFLLEEDNAKIYLEEVQRPTSLKSLIPWQQQNLDLAPFVNQVLTARSWYQGDSLQTEQILADAIEEVVAGDRSPKDALVQAASKVSAVIQLIKKELQ